jgi:two-component system nitrate/nitrite response regulator NarL
LSAPATRVLVVEDDLRIAEVIGAILAKVGFAALDFARTVRDAEACVRAKTPQLALVDLGLPDGDGVDLIERIRQERFAGAILVLTSTSAPERVLRALEAGADGYLFKEDMNARLASSLREVASGRLPLSEGAAQAVLERLRHSPRARCQAPLPALTPRERDVLTLLSTGAKYAEIAAELGIGMNTVRSHIRSLYDKCGVQNGAEAVSLAWNLGLLDQRT